MIAKMEKDGEKEGELFNNAILNYETFSFVIPA
jgi:hypothetical protein